jgi:hypothetical protein
LSATQTFLRVDLENNTEPRLAAHHPVICGLGLLRAKKSHSSSDVGGGGGSRISSDATGWGGVDDGQGGSQAAATRPQEEQPLVQYILADGHLDVSRWEMNNPSSMNGIAACQQGAGFRLGFTVSEKAGKP